MFHDDFYLFLLFVIAHIVGDKIHTGITRKSKHAFVVNHTTFLSSKTFICNGIKLKNNLPIEIQSICDNSVFKVKYKNLLFSEMLSLETKDFMFY